MTTLAQVSTQRSHHIHSTPWTEHMPLQAFWISGLMIACPSSECCVLSVIYVRNQTTSKQHTCVCHYLNNTTLGCVNITQQLKLKCFSGNPVRSKVSSQLRTNTQKQGPLWPYDAHNLITLGIKINSQNDTNLPREETTGQTPRVTFTSLQQTMCCRGAAHSALDVSSKVCGRPNSHCSFE